MIVETERLALREFTMADVDNLFGVLGDPVAMRYYPEPFTRSMTEVWIKRNLDRYKENGFGLWAVTLKEDGRFLGDCGLTLQPTEGRDEIEIGYHFLQSAWGHGYATEAARACRDYAFSELNAPRVCSIVGLDNIPSQRVARRVHLSERLFFWDKISREMLLFSTERALWQG